MLPPISSFHLISVCSFQNRAIKGYFLYQGIGITFKKKKKPTRITHLKVPFLILQYVPGCNIPSVMQHAFLVLVQKS